MNKTTTTCILLLLLVLLLQIVKMTKDKELKALFIMCQDLKSQVKKLSAEVKAIIVDSLGHHKIKTVNKSDTS